MCVQYQRILLGIFGEEHFGHYFANIAGGATIWTNFNYT